MKDYQTSSEEASATTNSFHYKYRRRKMMATQVTSLSLLSLLFITSHVRLTLGFAPHSLVSVSAPKKRHQFASQRSDDDKQSRPAPFFMENVDEQQQQQQQQQQQESANTSWNTVQQSNGYTQQQTEEQYSETTAVNGQYQSQQDYYYQESSQTQAAPEQQQQQQSSSTGGPYSSSQDDGGISNVDARVLESILADGKLDLNSEEEVKKLLEGPRRTEDFRVDFINGEEDESGKYSSKVISSVSDNKFWNSVRAKGFELIDTVGIIIANRIERDTKTLAAIGIFGLERIRQDLGRALPAAGRQVKKLLLSSNSTYVDQLLDATENTPFALPSERSMTEREMLTTPADEIKSVTGAILEILAGNELPESSSSSFSSPRRNLGSFAPAGTSKLAERQKRAYQARKKTVLKREREGIDRSFGRTIGSLTDATWELRREMQTGAGREAGYRTKGVRRALAAGATNLLQSGRDESRKLISGSRNRYERMIGGSSEPTPDANQNIMDVSAVEEAEIIQEVMEETNYEYAEDGLLSPSSFLEEKRRLIATLDSCLSQPGNTWLTKEVVTQATNTGINLDNDVLKEVITTMVTLRDQLQREVDEAEERQWMDLRIEYVQTELRRLKEMVDSISSLAFSAAGENAATLLRNELQGFVLSDNLDEIIDTELGRMEQVLAERVAARTEEVQSQRRQAMEARGQQVVAEVVDATVEWSQSSQQQVGNSGYSEVEVVQSQNTGWDADSSQSYSDQGGYSDQMPRSSVEVVSDNEYSDYEQSFRYAESGSMEEEEDVTEEENPATEFVLRVLDALFFVGEKLFFVVLPELITGGANISARYSQAQNRGTGSVGWKAVKNMKTKKNQY
uniref:Uncharacterized protein n=1 Tax=Skeletonema marinoi TaxID=267567 RepID=A0A7S2PJQ5_9STRA|mmetsp:Transcript_23068/g.39422  ORF Transcript_23068/g.39422 Transcript_23068/m.39422 type:complete len:853 (+) Transcript_23068:165-2723(+)